MKFFVVAVALVAVIVAVQADLTDEQKQKLLQHNKDCLAETSVDVEIVKKARKGDFSDDPKLKEFILCMSKKIGFQNDAGEVQVDVLKQKLTSAINNAETAQQLIEKCAVAKDTPQATAFETMKCYYENTPTHISIV